MWTKFRIVIVGQRHTASSKEVAIVTEPRLRRALSIRQPYAEQILRGVKTIEYRSQPTKIRERVYVYASQTPGAIEDFEEMNMQPGDLPTGVWSAQCKSVIARVTPETMNGIWQTHNV